MFKKIAAAAVALGLMATSAFSAEVFTYGYKYWAVNGYVGNGDASCVVSTHFDNGGVININVFPHADGTQYTTMTVYNPDWDPIPAVVDTQFNEAIVFKGRNTGTMSLIGTFQVYGDRKVILRELNGDFSYYFIKAREMIIFPGKVGEIRVSLVGTEAVSNALDSCMSTVRQY
jgi:hypothetical protein